MHSAESELCCARHREPIIPRVAHRPIIPADNSNGPATLDVAATARI
jgi:hypothetical protein